MIIEDQAFFNSMMQKILSNDYDIVCTCTSAKDMMSLYKKYTPDLILTMLLQKKVKTIENIGRINLLIIIT